MLQQCLSDSLKLQQSILRRVGPPSGDTSRVSHTWLPPLSRSMPYSHVPPDHQASSQAMTTDNVPFGNMTCSPQSTTKKKIPGHTPLNTGASLSAMQADIVQNQVKLKTNVKPWTAPTIPTPGADMVGLCFMGQRLFHYFTVVPRLPSTLVLGMDFMLRAFTSHPELLS